MKRINNIYYTLLAGLLLTGCVKEDTGPGSSVAVEFNSDGIAATRTTDGSLWVRADRIGIFMKERNFPLSGATIVGEADNIEYQAVDDNSRTSGFSPVGSPIYYPRNGTDVDFIAYYPYVSTLSGYILPLDISEQGDPSAIDVLYSDNAAGYNKNSGAVGLSFNHALAKITIQLYPGDGLSDISGCRAEFAHVYRSADFNLATGKTESPGNQGTVTARHARNTEHSAIVIPQDFSNVVLSVVLADGVSRFEWNFPAGSRFLPGNNYLYEITVSKTGITVTGGNIIPWEGAGELPITGDTRVRYKVGDYYPDPYVKYDPARPGSVISGTAAEGVVCWLDPSHAEYNANARTGTFGKIVSLDDTPGFTGSGSGLTWGPQNTTTGATSTTDGLFNMQTVYTFNGNSFSNYPAFAWVHQMNDPSVVYRSGAVGVWYLPAKYELKAMYAGFSGLVYEQITVWDDMETIPGNGSDAIKAARAEFNRRLAAAGGEEINELDLYKSSTETGPSQMYGTAMYGFTYTFNKNGADRARGIMAFGMPTTYKVGDYYPDPNVRYDPAGNVLSGTAAEGIVFWLDPAHSAYEATGKSGVSGKIISLKEISHNCYWHTRNPATATPATDYTDGLANMAVITGLSDWETDYPAFKWLHDTYNEGSANYNPGQKNVWYMPSIGELQHLYCAWNGKDPETWKWPGSDNPGTNVSWGAGNEAAREDFNSRLKAAGGAAINSREPWRYWSSTESRTSSPSDLAWQVNFNTSGTDDFTKKTYLCVRAISAF